ncbi:MAG: signal peptidase I [Eubacteriales bacterium]|nr:signal peptidase I [Eubacteriales bacterium]
MNNEILNQQETSNETEVDPVKPCTESTTPKKKGWKKELLEWIIALGSALVIAFVVRTFIFEPVKVSGRSMAETLQNGEIMITTKYNYWLGDPSRFDIVICKYPNRKETFVKRIVGLPGDTVSVENGLLTVNGTVYPEPYITHRPNYSLETYTVPDNMYFVLGDNRANSNDSHLVGPIERKQVIGHVRAVVFPFGNIRNVEPKMADIQP